MLFFVGTTVRTAVFLVTPTTMVDLQSYTVSATCVGSTMLWEEVRGTPIRRKRRVLFSWALLYALLSPV